MNNKEVSAVLLLSCMDRSGLVARIAHFIFEHGGNILDLDEHVNQEEQVFSIRVAWDMRGFSIPVSELKAAFAPLAEEFKATWDINFWSRKPQSPYLCQNTITVCMKYYGAIK